ncbi:hypothetical protein AAFN85_25160 [Mucilaginibacter sp. CAU 1740]|uniref:hypothetical protein n=1 Tax=Mucilaginibacter sp. CAU 1740 TaxID=3140365 RepID=UPI00325AEE3D
MLQLISKIQHNTYEKSEFSDEQPRDVDETIRLIKDFPWNAERPLTDIQLTGPSVTIIDNDLNYLKLGLFFNGKFCVYYLDNHNHLYEYHAPNIDEASNLVKDFFDQALDLKPFEKHFFNIGNKPHFITSDFVYRVNPVRVLAFALMFSAYITIGLSYFIMHAMNINGGFSSLIVVLIMILMGVLFGYVALVNINGRNQYLQISRGNTVFSYGPDEKHINTYNKADVVELLYLTAKGDRDMGNVRIIFKNGEIIQPKMLIRDHELIQKFPEKLGIKVSYIHKTVFGESKYA